MGAHRLDTLKTRRLAAGLSIGELARQSNTSDWVVTRLESGGSCDPQVTQRILDALGGAPVAITSSSVANPSQITTAANLFQTNDTINIASHSGSTPAINGDQTATRVSSTIFSIPVNVTIGGAGGTATFQPASVGIARLT